MSSPKIDGRHTKGSKVTQTPTADLRAKLQDGRKRDRNKIETELTKRG